MEEVGLGLRVALYIVCTSNPHMLIFTAFFFAVPRTPLPDVCAEYDRTNGTLQTIDTTWDELVCKGQSHCIDLWRASTIVATGTAMAAPLLPVPLVPALLCHAMCAPLMYFRQECICG